MKITPEISAKLNEAIKAETVAMTGFSEENMKRERQQLLDCTQEDIRKLAGYIEAFLSEDALCVVGNAEKLKAEADRFERLEKLQ